MMKKINVLLIVIAIIGSIYITITRDTNIVYILKDLSIILTINALYIIQKIFKVKINDKLNFVYVIFIFLAHFLGVTCELYNKIYWFDKFVHCMSGVVSSIGAIWILEKNKLVNSKLFSVLFIISFSLMIASSWEIFEYVSSILFNVDPQRVILTGVNDTMGDIIVAYLGSILISIYYTFKVKIGVK